MNVQAYSPSPDAAAGERRRRDRRSTPTRMPFHGQLFTPARRWRFRRAEDAVDRYVDQMTPAVMWWAFAVMLLSAADAALTLLHVQRGGDELVPTMRWALGHGPEVFVSLKMGLTAVGALLLAMHENFRLARLAIPVMLASYICLMAYHAWLVWNVW